MAVRVGAGSFARFHCTSSGPDAIVAGWQDVWTAEERAELIRAFRSDVELWPAGGSPTILVSVRR